MFSQNTVYKVVQFATTIAEDFAQGSGGYAKLVGTMRDFSREWLREAGPISGEHPADDVCDSRCIEAVNAGKKKPEEGHWPKAVAAGRR